MEVRQIKNAIRRKRKKKAHLAVGVAAQFVIGAALTKNLTDHADMAPAGVGRMEGGATLSGRHHTCGGHEGR